MKINISAGPLGAKLKLPPPPPPLPLSSKKRCLETEFFMSKL